jgi:hypothetical protein
MENGVTTYDLDASVEEKRKRDELDPPRSVRFKPMVEIPVPRSVPTLAPVPNPVPVPVPTTAPVPSRKLVDTDMPLVTPREGAGPVYPRKERYRLASELSTSVQPSDILKRILDLEIPLRIRDILGASPDIGNELVSVCRRKKHFDIPDIPTSNLIDVESFSTSAGPVLYSCASPYVPTVLAGTTSMEALIDGGSEVNIMSRGLFDQLKVGLDTEIHWEIGTLGSNTPACIGVVHDLPVAVGGVEIPAHCFIVDTPKSKFILGRPWERAARLKSNNRDDGSLWCKIYSLDGLRMAEFCGCPADHPRNRLFARDPFPSTAGN